MLYNAGRWVEWWAQWDSREFGVITLVPNKQLPIIFLEPVLQTNELVLKLN